jgi:hypothetical protein
MTVGAMAAVGVRTKIIQHPSDLYNPDLWLLLDNRTGGL